MPASHHISERSRKAGGEKICTEPPESLSLKSTECQQNPKSKCSASWCYLSKLIERSEEPTPGREQLPPSSSLSRNAGGAENAENVHRRQTTVSRMPVWSSINYGENLQKLGCGTYGVVYRTRLQDESESPCAIKVFRVDDEGLSETTVREIVLLRELRPHPNVLELCNVQCTSSDKIYLATELLDLDLREYIKQFGKILPMNMVKRIAYALLNGVAHCHKHGVIHRDLKPHNILVSRDLAKIKVGDFGLARFKHDPRKTLTHEVVTLWYRAPEILLGDCKYDESIDVWSCGCIIGELLVGKPLFPGDSEIATLFKILILAGTPSELAMSPFLDNPASLPRFRGKQIYAHLEERLAYEKSKLTSLTSSFTSSTTKPQTASADVSQCAQLITEMLQVVPRQRPSVEKCLEHQWFTKEEQGS